MNYGPEHFPQNTPEMGPTENKKRESTLPEAYLGSEILEMLNRQIEAGEIKTVLCVDIDNTFHKKGYEAAMRKLTEDARTLNIPIIAVTGNGYEGVLQR